MRTLSVCAFCALVLSASLAYGQIGQVTSNADGTTVITTSMAVVRVPDLDAAKPTFTARTTSLFARETVFDGDVVAQIEGMRVTADRAIVRDGEIRFEGNVRVERPAAGVAGARVVRYRARRMF
jgi:hypothetical protein